MTANRKSLIHQRLSGALFDGFVKSIYLGAKCHPATWPSRCGVEVIRNKRYASGDDDAHLLDVYRPKEMTGPLPAVLYVHGGSFSRLSKEIYYFVASTFARHGYVVFNIDYRLAPKYRFPSQLIDVGLAAEWIQKHGASFGADASRLVLAGDSAGANLVTGLTIASCYERSELWARRIWGLDLNIGALIATSGLLQVTEPAQRWEGRRQPAKWVRDALKEVADNYLPQDQSEIELVNPLRVLECAGEPQRSLPPVFAGAGTLDPLFQDTCRMKAALDLLGADCHFRSYEGGQHGFHVIFPWQERSSECWDDQMTFLKNRLSILPSGEQEAVAEERDPGMLPDAVGA